jgi:hypothetical protein
MEITCCTTVHTTAGMSIPYALLLNLLTQDYQYISTNRLAFTCTSRVSGLLGVRNDIFNTKVLSTAVNNAIITRLI